MADSFSDLGLRAELADAVAALGYERPSAIQRGAIPVIRRGGNVVFQASAGAGLVAAYGLGIVDRLAGSEPAGEEGPRALVIVPSPECAATVAVSLARFARAVGLRVSGTGPGWSAGAQASAEIRVMTLPDALRSIRTSRLKLDGLQALVIDHAPAIVELHGWDGIESIFVTIPRDAQRIVTAGAPSPELDDFVERHARRALYVPPRAVEEPEGAEPRPAAAATVDYVPVGGDAKFAAAAALLSAGGAAAAARFHCRTAAEAEELARALSLRGFEASAAGSVVHVGEDGAGTLVASLHAPVDAESLLSRHAAGGIVLVEPRHLPHLLRIAGEAGIALVSRTLPAPETDGELERFREMLRRAVAEEDIDAQILVLEPLLEEVSALELAAAASALLRRAPQRAEPEAPSEGGLEEAPPAYVRLFISVGNRDNLRPGDLVGAITGEADVPGAAVGRIEIRDTFSIVEVTREHAERVLKALNGITLKGRSVRADYDRKGSPAARDAARPRRGALGERIAERRGPRRPS